MIINDKKIKTSHNFEKILTIKKKVFIEKINNR